MNKNYISNKIKEHISVLSIINKDDILDSMSLKELGLDSLDVVELVFELEKEFNIVIDENIVERFQYEGIYGLINYIDSIINVDVKKDFNMFLGVKPGNISYLSDKNLQRGCAMIIMNPADLEELKKQL